MLAWRGVACGVRVVFCCGVVVLLSNYLPDQIVCSCARVFVVVCMVVVDGCWLCVVGLWWPVFF